MSASLFLACPFSPLEELRQKLLLQKMHNERIRTIREVAPKAILLVMKQKLARRGIAPNENDITFLGAKSVERDVLSFKYGAGFFSVIFHASYEEDKGGVVIEVTEAVNKIGIPFFYPGVVKGQRFLYEE